MLQEQVSFVEFSKHGGELLAPRSTPDLGDELLVLVWLLLWNLLGLVEPARGLAPGGIALKNHGDTQASPAQQGANTGEAGAKLRR